MTGMELTSEQVLLRDAVRGLLSSTGSPGQEGYDGTLWRRLCGEIGVASLLVPERHGGAGGSLADVLVVMAELGRALAPVPMLGSAVLATAVLLEAGDDTAGRLLPALAAGTTVAALAWAGEDGRWDPGQAACWATEDPAGGWRLSGEAHYVLDGDVAGVLLVAAHAPDEVAVFEVDPEAAGVHRRAVTTMDTTRRLATACLDGAVGRPVGCGPDGLARARDLACLALAAEQAGAARRALEQTVAYTRDRVQFGRPIGSFQALQHRMADLHVLTESAWSLCWAAAQDSSQHGDEPGPGLRAAAARAYCSEALLRVAGQMIQLHGAIGVTWEHDAHRYFKRAHGAGQLFGPPSAHLARIADTLLPG
ncbi:MAG TPA: acyl-CoA dehydrogenase family protein [Streptosporangiaceae bacterium]